MDSSLYLRGLVIGFGIALAIGPISLLVIRRTLDRGFAIGMASGLGVATADATSGAVAAFGLTVVTDILVGIRRPLAIAGGLFLVYLGIRALLAKTATRAAADTTADGDRSRSNLARAYVSILALTLTNPMTILSFVAVFAGLGVAGSGYVGAAAVTLGVFSGSTLWWIVLTITVATVRTRLTSTVLRGVNLLSGVIVAAFGVVAVASGLGG